jgi:hypothetical protein
MRQLLSAILYSCRKAGELMERRYDVPLSPLENARLKVHLRLCLSCQRYDEQSQLLQTFLDRYRNAEEPKLVSQDELKELENRILNNL